MRLKAAIKENDDLKKEQFKRSQRLFELRTKERELISEISGGQGQNKNLAARISQLDEQVCVLRFGLCVGGGGRGRGGGQNKNLTARISQLDEQVCACGWGWV